MITLLSEKVRKDLFNSAEQYVISQCVQKVSRMINIAPLPNQRILSITVSDNDQGYIMDAMILDADIIIEKCQIPQFKKNDPKSGETKL